MHTKEDQPGGGAVSTMDRIQENPKLIPQGLKQERFVRRRPWAAMNHQASGFVYRNVMLVPIDDLERLRQALLDEILPQSIRHTLSVL